MGGSVFNAGVKSHTPPWPPCQSEGWGTGSAPSCERCWGGAHLPPSSGVALGLAGAQQAFGCPSSRSGWACHPQEGSRTQGPAASSCPGLPPVQQRGRLCLWKPSDGSCRTSLMGWGAPESLWRAGVPRGQGRQGCICLPDPGGDIPLHLPGGFVSPDEIHPGLPAREAGV